MIAPVVRMHLRPTGERLPILVDRNSGMPLPLPLIYVVTTLRSRAANTIAQHLAGIQVLLLFCEAAGIQLDERIETGTLFRLHEIDALWDATARTVPGLAASWPGLKARPQKVIRLDYTARSISRDTVGIRRSAIRRYLAWLTERRLFALGHQQDIQLKYRVSRDELLRSLSARSVSQGRTGKPRHGLNQLERSALLNAVDVESASNPWRDMAVRQRNQLIVTLLFQLGLRRGELLALRLEDVDLRTGRIRLIRRPDNRQDTRRWQPVLKTQERVLELRTDLVQMLASYILDVRSAAPAIARRHGFLFVNQRTGDELSESTVEKIFRQLRIVDGLSDQLTCHVLRHDWNERFSEAMDEAGVGPAKERQLRRYLQGWSSEASAAVYTERHVRNRANAASLKMQEASLALRSRDDV